MRSFLVLLSLLASLGTNRAAALDLGGVELSLGQDVSDALTSLAISKLEY